MKILDKVINGFTIVKDYGYINGSRRATIICKVCLRHYDADPNKLIYRKHCGCIKHGIRVSKYTASYPRLIQVYKHMMGRCYRKTNKDYYNYGARGIIICEDWYKKPDNFCKWALENGYKENLTIDRINTEGNYSPENCRWADAKTQSRNTRRNVLTMELAQKMRQDKLTMTHKQLVIKYKVSYGTVCAVITNKVWK